MTEDKKHEVLEQRLEALTDEYLDLSTALADETDAVRKAKLKRQLKGVEKEMDDIEKKLEARSSESDYHQKLLDLRSKLPEINFRDLEETIRKILRNHQEDGCAALILFQRSTKMGGEWCAARIRDLLRRETSDRGFRHIPVEFQVGESADSIALLMSSLGRHLGIKFTSQDLRDFSHTIIQKICGSLQSGSIIMIECRRCDYLTLNPKIFRWILEYFWGNMLCELTKVAKERCEVKIIMLLFVDGLLPGDCLATDICCSLEQFDKAKLLEIPLKEWTREDIREWIARYSGLPLLRVQVNQIADKIYKATEGDPTLVAYELLKECCPEKMGENRNHKS